MTIAHFESKGEINTEIINIIIKMMESILGKNMVQIILNRCHHDNVLSSTELVYAFAQETQTLLGHKGSYATLRQVGRSIAKGLMAQHPKAEWKNILKQTLNHFGYAYCIEQEIDKAFIVQCVFYDKLTEEGLQPTQHAVCWIGWGFIEGFMKPLENIKSINWVCRDIAHQRCEFVFNR